MTTEALTRFMWFIEKSKLTALPHQTEAVRWMLSKEFREGVRGGILADEMGLGKTIMMLGLFISNYVRKTLIVVPAPLVQQWVNEMKRTTGHKMLIWSSKISKEALDAAPFVITTYNKVSLKKSEKNETCGYDTTNTTELHKLVWDRVVYDEAHHLRNKNGNFWSAKVIRSGAKWLISGTPVQNKKEDFYNLCSVLGLAASFYSDKEKRQELLDTYYLRRTKKELGIEIPELEIKRRAVEWSSEAEMKLSHDIHTSSKIADNNSRLKLINYARQSCTLPGMLKPKIPELMKDHHLDKDETNKYMSGASCMSKIDDVLKVIIERKDNGAGKLVFCSFRQEIDIIASRLSKEGNITSIGKLDGRTKPKDKTRMIKEGVEVLILQIQTGCEGINLQEHYSEIYFVSPNWNPAVEEQAIARCHRIGQKKDVTIFNFNMIEMKNLARANSATANNATANSETANATAEEGDQDEDEESLDQYIRQTQERKNLIRLEFE